MNFTCYVLSLFDEFKRRDSIGAQLKDLSIDYEIIDAVDFRRASLDMKLAFVKKNKMSTIKRELVNGEVGCSLSHFRCYQKLLSSNVDWGLIIEDDADLGRLKSGYIEDLLSAVANSAVEIDVVILGYSKLAKDNESFFYRLEPIKKLINCRDFCLGKPWRNWTCGTVSYLISKTGAEKMLNYFSDGKVVTVADDWNFFEKQVGLNIIHHRPLLVFEDFTNFKSALEPERAKVSKKKTIFLDAIRVLRGYFRIFLMRFIP